MKRIIPLISALGLAVILCACGSKNENIAPTTENNVVEENVEEVVEETTEESIEEASEETSEETVEETVEETTEAISGIVGDWTQMNAESDSYLVLQLREDGSGKLMNEPEDIGVPLIYEVDGNSIMTHLASPDDNTPMEYLPDKDQIQYGDIFFSRGLNTAE